MHKRQNILLINSLAWILILPTSSLTQDVKVRQQILALKAIMGLASTTSACILLHRNRPTALDAKYKSVEQMKQTLEAKVVESNSQTQKTIEHVVDQSNRRIEEVTHQFNQQLELREKEIKKWQQRYIEANSPKYPVLAGEAGLLCANVQRTLHTEGMIFDVCDPQPSTIPDRSLPGGKLHHWTLKPRNQEQYKEFLKLDKSNLLIPLLENGFGNLGQIEWEPYQGAVAIRYRPGVGSTKIQNDIVLEKAVQQEKAFPTIADTVHRGLGYLVAGESGSGKTSTGLVVAQAIIEAYQGESVEAMVLDVHANKNPVWQELGISRIYSSPAQILAAFEWIQDEYESRKAGGKSERLIIFIDEISEMFTTLKGYLLAQGSSTTEAGRELALIGQQLISLGTGGRKYHLTPIIFNQSPNCKELRMDAKQRDNFIGILLNSVADKYAHSMHCTNQLCAKWLSKRSGKYRAILTGAFNDTPILHPTHHGYSKIQNHQPPEVEIKLRFDGVPVGSDLHEPEELTEEIIIPDFAPVHPDFEGAEVGEQALSTNDLQRLGKIHDLWLLGEYRILQIICKVWEPVKKGSRQYRHYREEYRRLTGK